MTRPTVHDDIKTSQGEFVYQDSLSKERHVLQTCTMAHAMTMKGIQRLGLQNRRVECQSAGLTPRMYRLSGLTGPICDRNVIANEVIDVNTVRELNSQSGAQDQPF